MNQREMWNKIAPQWQRLRNKPHPDAEQFLSAYHGFVLDIGCGSGRHLIKGNRYAAFDFVEQQVLQAKKKITNESIDAHLVLASADTIPFKDNLFDAVLAANVLHVMDAASRQKCISEMKRVMKPGASAFISVWNRRQPRFFLKQKETYIPWKVGGKQYMRYYYLFTKSELKSLLERNGFRVLRIFGSSRKAFKLFPMDIVAIVQKTQEIIRE